MIDLQQFEKIFRGIGIGSTIAMLESEKRQHVLKIMELQNNFDHTAHQIKERCAGYIDYIIGEIARLKKELEEL